MGRRFKLSTNSPLWVGDRPEIRRLVSLGDKASTHEKIVVNASRPLVRTLMEHDLVDELRLTLFPVVLGAGERLFGETTDRRPLRLVHTKTIGNGLAHRTYERAREEA